MWLLLALLAVIALFVHRHTLQSFFALDDLILFQQAGGIRPWPFTAWRWLSGWAWFRVAVPLWGHEPFPYHLVSLLLHVTNALLLFALARRWGASPLAAWVGAAVFAVSRLHFPALLAITSIGELLSLALLLTALLCMGPPPRLLHAMAALALAVAAKESVMLVSFAALLVGQDGGGWRARARSLAPMLAGVVLLGTAFLWNGIGSGRLGGEAYAVSFGVNLLENVARLFGWSVDVADPIPDLHATSEGAARFVLPAVALALTWLAFRRGGSPLLRAGVAWWWLAVLPVLPLPGRTYLHYLYVPLAGLALVVAALVQSLLARRSRTGEAAAGRGAWSAALAAVLAFALWNDVLLTLRMDLRMTSTDWPLDPVLRKSEIARRGIEDVRQALGGTRAHVAILIPVSISRDVDLGTGRVSENTRVRRYALQAVLDDGRSLRALVPAADSVAIVHDYEPGRLGWTYFLSRSDSHLVPLGTLPGAHVRFVEVMLGSGLTAAAEDYARKALANRPDDAAMRALLERATATVR